MQIIDRDRVQAHRPHLIYVEIALTSGQPLSYRSRRCNQHRQIARFEIWAHVCLHLIQRCHISARAAHSARRVPPVIHKRCGIGDTAAVGLARHPRTSYRTTSILLAPALQLHHRSLSPPLCEILQRPALLYIVDAKYVSVGIPTAIYPLCPADEVKTKDLESPLASQVQVQVQVRSTHSTPAPKVRAVPRRPILALSHRGLVLCLISPIP